MILTLIKWITVVFSGWETENKKQLPKNDKIGEATIDEAELASVHEALHWLIHEDDKNIPHEPIHVSTDSKFTYNASTTTTISILFSVVLPSGIHHTTENYQSLFSASQWRYCDSKRPNPQLRSGKSLRDTCAVFNRAICRDSKICIVLYPFLFACYQCLVLVYSFWLPIPGYHSHSPFPCMVLLLPFFLHYPVETLLWMCCV